MRTKWDTFWESRWNVIRGLYEAFLCTRKNGRNAKEFSSKKWWAFVLMCLAVGNHAHLHFDPLSHWVVELSNAGISDFVIGAMITSLDVLAGWAAKVYKDAYKAEQAAIKANEAV